MVMKLFLHDTASIDTDRQPPDAPRAPLVSSGALRLLAGSVLVVGLIGKGFFIPWLIALICYGVVLRRQADSRALRAAKVFWGVLVVLWGVGIGYWNTYAYNTVTFETRERRVYFGVTVEEAVRETPTSKVLRLRETKAFTDAEIDAGWITDHAWPWLSTEWSGRRIPYDRKVRKRLWSNEVVHWEKPIPPSARVEAARLLRADLLARSNDHANALMLLYWDVKDREKNGMDTSGPYAGE